MSCQAGGNYYWVDWSSSRGVHNHAVLGGKDLDGSQIYVGRAYHAGDWIPAKVIPQKRVAYISYGGNEIAVHNFQVLCEQRFQWARERNGRVPHNAVIGGRTATGENLYIGRAHHAGAHTVGKIHPSHGCLYIPFNGKEVAIKDYEVLTLQ
ncbi:natterin-3-like [Onthophagus taurus]|uniref:natterin-3-like n=1 Tax=Onthophagus taurus TaxID=166361 RepID=UPI000C20B11A|nr:natterin-3-like [Onthophagus taurus]